MKKAIELDRDELYNLYMVENKSLAICSKLLNVPVSTIRINIGRYGFKKTQEMIHQGGRRTLDELPEDEKMRRSKAQSERTKQSRAKIKADPVKSAQMTERQSKSHIETWANMPKEKYDSICEKCSIAQNSRTPEQRAAKLEKEIATKKANGTFTTSKPEKDYELYLKSIYGDDNVIAQYVDDRYRSPHSGKKYWCDFYIKSKDLFIECNWFWMHGFKPYDPTDKWCINKLASWQEKALTSKTYRHAIYVWTQLDVEKRTVAKENNLNFLEVY